jgi:hypothetical protein
VCCASAVRLDPRHRRLLGDRCIPEDAHSTLPSLLPAGIAVPRTAQVWHHALVALLLVLFTLLLPSEAAATTVRRSYSMCLFAVPDAVQHVNLVLACSSTNMMLYPLQAGTFNASVCHSHRDRLMAVAASFDACCDSVAACLEDNAPIAQALEVGSLGWETASICLRHCLSCLYGGYWYNKTCPRVSRGMGHAALM